MIIHYKLEFNLADCVKKIWLMSYNSYGYIYLLEKVTPQVAMSALGEAAMSA